MKGLTPLQTTLNKCLYFRGRSLRGAQHLGKAVYDIICLSGFWEGSYNVGMVYY